MNVFLAGASGVVGLPLTRLLVARGHRVFGMTRTPGCAPMLWSAGAIPVVVDAFDAPAIERALLAVRPDAVIHQLTDLPYALEPSQMAAAVVRNARIRTIGTANLVTATVLAGTKRMIAQSIGWAYRPDEAPWREDCALDTSAAGSRAITIGGVVALEEAVLQTPGLEGCVLRHGALYGPGTGSSNRDGRRMPLHVEAAAWGALLALEHRANGAFNLAEDDGALIIDKARTVLGWAPGLRLDTRAIDSSSGQTAGPRRSVGHDADGTDEARDLCPIG